MEPAADLRRIVIDALNLAGRGAHDEAIRTLQAAGSAAMAHPIVRNLLGDIYLRQGRKREALKAFDAAAKAAPNFPEVHCNRGVALQQLGRLEEALAAYDRALKQRPAYPLALFNRANTLRDLGRLADAILAYGRAIALEPRFAEALLNRGTAFLRSEQPLAALDDFDRALRARGKYPEALVGRVEALHALERYDEAVAAADRILVDDANPVVLATQALSLKGLRRLDEALAAADRLVENHPEEARGHAARSEILRGLRRFEEALAEADEAVRLAPGEAGTHIERSNVLSALGRAGDQLAALERAERLGGSPSEIGIGRAVALAETGRPDEADGILRKLIGRDPEKATLRYNRSLLLLHRGDFARGFEEFERRIGLRNLSRRDFDSVAPRWRGEPLAGRRLLVYGEQGFGDDIQFARYLPLVAAAGGETSLRLGRPLHRLLAALADGMALVDGAPAGTFDVQVSIMSLAHVFGTTPETIPPTPYLAAETALVEKWRGRLGDTGYRVGVVWQGNPNLERDRFRSMPLARLAPLAEVPGVRLISLQALNGVEQLDSLPGGMKVERPGDEIGDPANGFAEIAGIIANLDLVVAADTAVGHLAGALGRPVWSLQGAQHEWRWLAGRSDTPWYPSMRIFRQTKLGEWDSVIADVARELRAVARR